MSHPETSGNLRHPRHPRACTRDFALCARRLCGDGNGERFASPASPTGSGLRHRETQSGDAKRSGDANGDAKTSNHDIGEFADFVEQKRASNWLGDAGDAN